MFWDKLSWVPKSGIQIPVRFWGSWVLLMPCHLPTCPQFILLISVRCRRKASWKAWGRRDTVVGPLSARPAHTRASTAFPGISVPIKTCFSPLSKRAPLVLMQFVRKGVIFSLLSLFLFGGSSKELPGHQTAGFYHFADWVHSIFFVSSPQNQMESPWQWYETFMFFHLSFIWKNTGKTDCMPRLLALENSLPLQTYYLSN